MRIDADRDLDNINRSRRHAQRELELDRWQLQMLRARTCT